MAYYCAAGCGKRLAKASRDARGDLSRTLERSLRPSQDGRYYQDLHRADKDRHSGREGRLAVPTPSSLEKMGAKRAPPIDFQGRPVLLTGLVASVVCPKCGHENSIGGPA